MLMPSLRGAKLRLARLKESQAIRMELMAGRLCHTRMLSSELECAAGINMQLPAGWGMAEGWQVCGSQTAGALACSH